MTNEQLYNTVTNEQVFSAETNECSTPVESHARDMSLRLDELIS